MWLCPVRASENEQDSASWVGSAATADSAGPFADRCDASIGNRRKGERNHPCPSTSVGKRIEERQERLGISIASVIVRKRKERQW